MFQPNAKLACVLARLQIYLRSNPMAILPGPMLARCDFLRFPIFYIEGPIRCTRLAGTQIISYICTVMDILDISSFFFNYEIFLQYSLFSSSHFFLIHLLVRVGIHFPQLPILFAHHSFYTTTTSSTT